MSAATMCRRADTQRDVEIEFSSCLRGTLITADLPDTRLILSTETRTLVSGQPYYPDEEIESEMAQCIITAMLGLACVVSVTVRSNSVSIKLIKNATDRNRVETRRAMCSAVRRATEVDPVVV